jgi:hypothetical protein
MARLNKNGFGIVEVILLIAIIVATGLIGYYVYANGRMSDESNQTTKDADASSVQTAEYVNKEFGFKFSYPVTNINEAPTVFDTTPDVGPVLGKSYSIGVEPKFVGGFVTNNFAMAPDKVESMPLGFSVYTGCKPDESVLSQVVIYRAKDACVVINASEELAPGSSEKSLAATMIVQKKFSKNQDIAGLEFARSPIAIESSAKNILKKAYGGTVNDDTITFAKSIQEL